MAGPSKFRHVLVLGVAIRLVLAPFFAHPYDVYVWYEVGQKALSGTQPLWSFLSPYSYSFFLFVFPAALAFQALSGLVGSFVTSISSLNPVLNLPAHWSITVVPGPLFDFLVKLPLILSDTLVAILLYRIVLREPRDERLAVAASLGWFLNPLVIWVSSGWGMFDTLPVLFTVLALYSAMQGKFVYAGVELAGAIALKYYAVVLIIPMMIMAWKKGGRRAAIASFGAALGTALILFLPLVEETISGFNSVIAGPVGQGLVYSGLSFWSGITLFVPFPYQTILSSALIVGFLGGAYYWMTRRSSAGLYSYALEFAIPIVLLLIFFRFVGENFFVWIVPFASILALEGSRSKWLFWATSLVALLSSVTDSFLPYYMLPMARWIGGFLVWALASVASYQVAPGESVVATFSIGKLVLAALGVSAAALLVLLSASWLSTNRSGGVRDLLRAEGPAKKVYYRLVRLV